MRTVTLLLLFFASLRADFISAYEYGEALYHDPRGVSCAACHGPGGEGKNIATILQHGRKVTIAGPALTNLSRTALERALRRGRSIMPTYDLTQGEIDALYTYLSDRP